MQEIIQKIRQSVSRGQLPTISSLISQESDTQRAKQIFDWYQQITTFSLLQELILAHPHFEEVIIHGDQHIQIKGVCAITNCPSSSHWNEEDLQLAYEILVIKKSVAWNYKCPFVSFDYQFSDHTFRLSLLHFSCTENRRSKLFLRSQYKSILTLQDFLPQHISKKMKDAIDNKRNIIIAGATSSGKTTFLKTLLHDCPPKEHTIILEDFNEIQTDSPYTTHLISSELNQEHQLESYCKYALRMAAERTIIGEIRSAEVVPLILSLNTGSKGMMTTLHANSALDVIPRLATLFITYSSNNMYFENVEKLIGTNMDIIIYMQEKKIDHIIEIIGFTNSRPIYNYIYNRNKCSEAA